MLTPPGDGRALTSASSRCIAQIARVYSRPATATRVPRPLLASRDRYSRPATAATKLATACASAPWMRPAGIVPYPRHDSGLFAGGFCRQPLTIVLSTREAGGFNWSRFGPTLPAVLAAARVWHTPQ